MEYPHEQFVSLNFLTLSYASEDLMFSHGCSLGGSAFYNEEMASPEEAHRNEF